MRVLERGWVSSNNILLFDSDDSATLIDTGYVAHSEQTLQLVRHALDGRKLARIINTHLHSDHCGGNALLKKTLGPAAWADQEPCATVAALKEAQTAVDRRLLKVVEALDGAGLQRIVSVHRGTSIQRERMDRLLLHLFQHDVHHRGQAHAMLSGTSVSPPQLDEFFAVGEAPLRAAEFAELGWTEERIWGGSDTKT